MFLTLVMSERNVKILQNENFFGIFPPIKMREIALDD